MRYRNLGSSDLKVSEISLGAWLTYAGGIEVGADTRLHRGRIRRGHQLLRHRERLRAWRGRDAPGARSSPSTRATHTSWRPRSTARCPTTPRTGASPLHRSPSRSMPHSNGCRPSTSTSTRLTVSTSTCRSRRRSKPCSRSCSTARPGTSASASGRPSRSRPRSTSPDRSCSSPHSRSTQCSGRRPRWRCSRSARRTGYRRSSGRRWLRGC